MKDLKLILILGLLFYLNCLSQSAGEGSYKAVKREYAIIGDAEGDSMDAYTYSGTFRATGKRVVGTATVDGTGAVATFTETL